MKNKSSTFLSHFLKIFVPNEFYDFPRTDKILMAEYLITTHGAIFAFSFWKFFHYTLFKEIRNISPVFDISFFVIFYFLMTLPFIFANTSLFQFVLLRKKTHSIYHLYWVAMGCMLGIVTIFLSLPILELVDRRVFDICGCYIATIN